MHPADGLPGGDEGLAGRLQDPDDLLRGPFGVLGEDDGEEREDAVEGVIGEGELLGLGHLERALPDAFAS